MASRGWIYALFFLSGGSGLIYQIVWIREFGNVFGNTIHSASLVTAVFIGGLGVGSLVAGRWADRSYRAGGASSLRTYGAFEVSIALLGLLISVGLPHLEDLSSMISSYVRDESGWLRLSAASHLLRYAIAVVLLFPITFLMGGTLTLLVRHLVRGDLSVTGVRIGLLYGINTAGAACGCLLTDFALIPNLGLFATQTIAVVGNLIAGFGALRLARSVEETRERAIEPSSSGAESNRAITFVGLAVFTSGFVGMALEILWFRHLISSAGAFRAVFSILLTVILVGIWIGSIAAGYLDRRFGRPALLYAVSQAALPVLVMGLFYFGPSLVYVDVETLSNLGPFGQRAYHHFTTFRLVVILVGAPALLMGVTYPLANAIVQRVEGNVGGRAGGLYLANTLGAVVGALLTGFVLLPAVGTVGSITVVGLVTLPGIAAVALADARRSKLMAGGGVFVLAATLLWTSISDGTLEGRPIQRKLDKGDTLLSLREGVTETIAVVERSNGDRTLFTNGHDMSSTSFHSQRYMRAFAHVPLLAQDRPVKVLVICFGVGNTADAATMHPSVETVEVVDLSPFVLDHASYFEGTNHRVLSAPKVLVHVNDGRQHLRMQPEGSYDLITLEPPPIAFAGVSALYSREFYDLAKSRLRPGGYVTQWLPAHQTTEDANLAMVRAFVDAFPASVLLSGYARDLIMMGINGDTLQIDPDSLATKLAGAPLVRADLEAIEMAEIVEIIGSFVASAPALREATDNVLPVTDDYPMMEYAVGSILADRRIPASLFRLETVGVWCPRCVSEPELVPTLVPYLEALSGLYRDPSFLESSWRKKSKAMGTVRITPNIRAAIASSPYLRRTFAGSL